MHISTDLAAVRVPEDEVGLYNVTASGWYAIDGEDKAILGPFEVSAYATGRFAIGSASWHRRTFPVPVPRFTEAGLCAQLPAQATLIQLSFRPRGTWGIPRRFANRRRVSLSVSTISR